MPSSLLRQQQCKTPPQQNFESGRYLRKSNTDNERTLFEMYWGELIGRWGTNVEYYTYNYSLSTQDYLYGEDPVASFSGPTNIVMFADIASEAILLSKFGIETDADVTLLVHMENYARTFGENVEPKSGDVIRLTELGWDVNEVPGYGSDVNPLSGDILNEVCMYKGKNPATLVYPPTSNLDGDPISGSDRWVRCPQLFEITDRAHQDMTLNTNMLLGHYVWVLKAKRFDYSYQPGIEPECFMGDVGEETRTGLLSGYNQPQSEDKDYPGNVEEESNTMWDYDTGDEARGDEVYGSY
jgi:hypothetical protein